jgi:hypothetical protein
MANAPQDQQAEISEISRRSLLGGLASAAGGAALLGAGMTVNRADAAPAKTAQKAVAYQETPKGELRCDNCKQFEPASSCKVVEGTINPAGWCKVYIKKPAV